MPDKPDNPLPEDLIKELQAAIQSLKSPSVEPAINIAVRPRGWSNSTVASYYKAAYAIELKAILDTIMEPNKDFLLRHELQRPPMTKRALEAKLAQSFHYLIDNMDTPDKKYALLRSQLEISMRHPEGVLLKWKRAIRAVTDTMVGELIESEIVASAWKERIYSFIDNAKEGQKLEINNAGLTDEDILWLNNYLSDLSDIILHPKSNKNYIKIIKSSILKEL